MTGEIIIPEIILKGIKFSIELSKKCTSEDDKIHPKVGAIIVKNDKIIQHAYRGELAPGDHAEYTALVKKKGELNYKDAILITTLEPCTRRNIGKKACVEHIAENGIKEVYIGIPDPNPDITNRGYIYLINHNIKVEFFPYKFANQVKEINKSFWEHETKKYKRDVMANISSRTLNKEGIKNYIYEKEKPITAIIEFLDALVKDNKIGYSDRILLEEYCKEFLINLRNYSEKYLDEKFLAIYSIFLVGEEEAFEWFKDQLRYKSVYDYRKLWENTAEEEKREIIDFYENPENDYAYPVKESLKKINNIYDCKTIVDFFIRADKFRKKKDIRFTIEQILSNIVGPNWEDFQLYKPS